MQIIRTARCHCGALQAHCHGEPARISICHCLACQRRTGAPFAAQSRFDRTQVTVEGRGVPYTRGADSGNTITFFFCGACGSTVYWELSGFPNLLGVALGMFADPSYPAPTVSVHEATVHPWVRDVAELLNRS